MSLEVLKILWFLVIGLSVIMYAVLDGFDLGVGALHLLARTDEQRRIFLNAIGPVWDGNEVWLVIILGGLFAGFPNVYATALSGFYNLFMIMIAGLMFRAAAIEFRSKKEGPIWRGFWDCTFSFASILVAFVIGLLLGNFIEGVPLDRNLNYIGTFWYLFRPYPVLVGFTGVSLFAMHGATYLVLKTEGEIHDRLKKWIIPSIAIFFIFYAVTTTVTIIEMPHMTERMLKNPLFFIFPVLAFLIILNVPFQIKRGRDGFAFISSCLSIFMLLLVYGLGMYPTIIRSDINTAQSSLTLYNASAAKGTLEILLIVVLIGIPFVLGYGFWVYKIFGGKVKLDETSY